jgi:Protein of unknown function (DUF2637)/DDE superfamily endonuclease
VADRLIRVTAALAVAAVAAVAAVISYRHAHELVTTHGETGLTATLVPFTVDGLILAASMLILDASRHHHPVPPLARRCLGAGIAATIGANLAHGLDHGPIGALVSAWPALALAGSFELLMTLIRTSPRVQPTAIPTCHANSAAPAAAVVGRAAVTAGRGWPAGAGADVSNWLRPGAATGPDRLFCHVYGRGKGQAQMIPGWPYSVITALEPGRTSWTGGGPRGAHPRRRSQGK